MAVWTINSPSAVKYRLTLCFFQILKSRVDLTVYPLTVSLIISGQFFLTWIESLDTFCYRSFPISSSQIPICCFALLYHKPAESWTQRAWKNDKTAFSDSAAYARPYIGIRSGIHDIWIESMHRSIAHYGAKGSQWAREGGPGRTFSSHRAAVISYSISSTKQVSELIINISSYNSIANGRINGRQSPCEEEFNAESTSITTVPVTRYFPCSYRHCLPTDTFPYLSNFNPGPVITQGPGWDRSEKLFTSYFQYRFS